jgi:probable O-glycosylation ligase (exosortase A-associated)
MKGLLFTYALTYGGAVVSLFNPFVGLLIYISFAIIKPESLWHWSVPQGNYSRIIALALLVGWAANGFGNWHIGRARATVLALVGYLVWCALSSLQAYDTSVSWSATEATIKIVLPFVVGITIIDSVEKLKALAWVIMLSQGYVAYDLNMSFWSGYNRMQDAGFGGMDNNCNAIAMVCGAGFAFFLGLAETSWRRWLAFLAAAFMTHAVFFAFSRGGMVALIIAGVAAFILIPKKPSYYFYLALAVILGLRMAGPEVRERFYSTFADKDQRDESAQSRIDMWQTCVELTEQNPLFGIGPNNFPVVAERLGYTQGKQAHSLWLQVAAEVGVPGIGFLAGFYLITMYRLWWLARAVDPYAPDIANSCRMVIAALIGFMVAGQFVSLAGLEIPYYVVLVGAGYLKLSDALVVNQTDSSETDDDYYEADDALRAHGSWKARPAHGGAS